MNTKEWMRRVGYFSPPQRGTTSPLIVPIRLTYIFNESIGRYEVDMSVFKERDAVPLKRRNKDEIHHSTGRE
ncbi:MAG: hypothetical protein DDT19_02814 [Syntrophomonadaceae bacterium]|nr:hypothetical protein [Bacillota bacterium]